MRYPYCEDYRVFSDGGLNDQRLLAVIQVVNYNFEIDNVQPNSQISKSYINKKVE